MTATTDDTSIVFYGYWHLSGLTVAVSILGLDCGDYTVAADGSVTVPYASDAGALLTPAYILANSNSIAAVEQNCTFSIIVSGAAHTVTVPVVIGLTYTTQGQLLRPDSASDIKSALGPGLGKTRRSHMYAALVQDAVKISFGTDFSNLEAALFSVDGETVNAENVPFSGVVVGQLDDDYSFEGQLAWQVIRPYACTVMSVSVFLDVSER